MRRQLQSEVKLAAECAKVAQAGIPRIHAGASVRRASKGDVRTGVAY